MGEMLRGVADADSATEADILEKRLNIREGDRLSLVSEWILEIAEKLDQLVQANISRDEAVKIVGPQGEFWQEVKTTDYEEIAGEFQYSMNMGATSPQLPQLERAQFIALLQLFANFPQILTNPHLVKRVMEMHNFDDEVVVKELVQMAQKMMSGMMPMPGQQGSTAGSPGQPGAATAGAALGMLGGLFNGGGAKPETVSVNEI
jgi:predicted ATP-grasp superfamily ATP-dependent carboligase